MIHGTCDRLGIKRFRLHEFRRRLGCRLAEGGSGIYTIARTLGYSTKRLPFKDLGHKLPFEIPPLDLQLK